MAKLVVSITRAKILEDLARSQGWEQPARTLANGIVQLAHDRLILIRRIRMAITASKEGAGADVVEEMLRILDPDNDIFDPLSLP